METQAHWEPPSPPPALDGWQPIETAPMDRRVLLLWHKTQTNTRHVVVGYKGRSQWLTQPGAYAINAVAWMPAPPTEEN